MSWEPTSREVEQLTMWTLEGVTVHELCRRFHRGTSTIRQMQTELELIDGSQIRGRWTQEQLELVRSKYADMPTAELAKLAGRSVLAINGAAFKLGVHKSEEYLASPAACRLRRGDEIGKQFRYSRGHVPANKGKKSPGVAPGRMRETQFYKGQRSINTMDVGSLRWVGGASGPYLYRKVSESGTQWQRWKPEHHLVWEKAKGPIPKKHRVVFKNRIRTDFSLDNLEMITMAELARRNSIHRLPEPLKQVIRLNGWIKRKIRRLDEEQNAGLEEPPLRDARRA